MAEAIFYHAKIVDFGGHSRVVLYPSHAHQRCALLALGNALLLRGVITLSIEPGDTLVPRQQLVLKMIQHYRKLHRGLAGNDVITKPQMETTIKLLSQPIDISLDFTRIGGIRSNTVGLQVFEHMGIHLYHTWIVDPEDAVVAPVLGTDYHVVFIADDPAAQPPVPIEGQLVVDFFGSTGLTTFGLQDLSDGTVNDQICVLFWNRSFHTIVMHNDRLYVLHNDLDSISGDNIWKEFNVGDDGRLCTSDFTPAVQGQNEAAATSSQVRKHKCNIPSCQLEFFSVVNLNRHDQVHSKNAKAKKGSVSKTDIGKYWDELTVEEARNILSIKPMKIKGLSGEILYRLIEKTEPTDQFYNTANGMKVIIDSPKKISSDELFAVLNEASEETAFSTDIRYCPNKSLFDLGIFLLREASNVLACCSYFVEMNLVARWFDHREAEALKSAKNLLEEDAEASSRMCGVSGCTMRFFSEINFNRHQQVHSEGSSANPDIMLNRDDISNFWDDLTPNEARLIMSFNGMNIEGFRGKKLARILGNVDPYSPLANIAQQLKAIISSSEKTESNELFAVLDKASEGTLFCTDIRGCRDNIIFEGSTYSPTPSLSNVLGCVSYMLERRLGEKWFDFNAAKARKVKVHLLDEDIQQEIKL